MNRCHDLGYNEMILSFADKRTERVFEGQREKTLPADVAERARVKLGRIDDADEIDDLRTPPGNRLERLTGDRNGQYSIRVNRRWRICFVFGNANASRVELNAHYG